MKVSVLIPHRTDRQKIITMESLAAQTLKDVEIIIKYDHGKEGAAATRNRCAEAASGEYFFFSDDDIILEPECLEKMARVLDEHEDVDFVYCDYARTGHFLGIQRGELWDPELLKQRNYISTMSMVRADAFKQVLFDENLTRYQDWDLWLNMADEGFRGYYIPEVLFTAHFEKKGISMGGVWNRFQKTAEIKEYHGIKSCMYSIIIPVHNQLELTEKCLETVVKNTWDSYEVIVVDDNSDRDTALELKDKKGIQLIKNIERLGHTECINKGVAASSGKFLCLLNNDTLVPPGWNKKLATILRRNMNISAVGPVTSNSASIQQILEMHKRRMDYGPSDIESLDNMVTSKLETKATIAKITGFCMMTTKFIWDVVGPFDADIEAGGNEADWLIRAMKIGLYPAVFNGVYVHHYGNQSYANLKQMQGLWNKGNKYVLEKHGKDWYEKLEKELFMDIAK